MAKRAQSSRRAGKAPGKIFIGIKVARPEKAKLDELKEAFQAKAVAVLGLESTGSYTNQTPIMKRPPPKRPRR
jgi:hypothetical protein